MKVDTEEVLQILEHFSQLEDPRSPINRLRVQSRR
jgi:hypothetical protein